MREELPRRFRQRIKKKAEIIKKYPGSRYRGKAPLSHPAYDYDVIHETEKELKKKREEKDKTHPWNLVG